MVRVSPSLLLSTACAVTLGSLPAPLPAQGGSGSAVCKVVAFDMGELWPAFLSVHLDGSVEMHGNPWLGGGSQVVFPSGANDCARLDALQVSDPEQVAIVGVDGLTMLQCERAKSNLTLTTWTDPALLGARAVRASRFDPQHVVVALAADGATLRSYRGGGAQLGAYTCSEAVADFLPFVHANGTARIVALTSAGIACTTTGGTLKWSVAGVGGRLAAWPGSGPIKAAWMYRDSASGQWRVATLGDAGLIASDDVSAAFASGEDVVACFAVDGDNDGDNDWVVKTASGVSVLWNDGSDRFVGVPAAAEWPLSVSAGCVPDLLRTQAGANLRLVDDIGEQGVGWTPLGFGTQQLSADGIGLYGTTWLAGPPPANITSIQFQVAVAQSWLSPLWQSHTSTYLQVVSWRQENPGLPKFASPEANVLFQMAWSGAITQDTRWPLSISVAPPIDGNGWVNAQDAGVDYWLTVRLVQAVENSTTPIAASEAVTLGMTCSPTQLLDGYSVLLGYSGLGDPGSLPQIHVPTGAFQGGGVVGVIVKINVPPPPSSSVPSPHTSDQVQQSTGSPLYY